MVTKEKKIPENNVEKLVDRTAEDQQENLAGQETIMPPVVDPEYEPEPEPEAEKTESEKLDALLKRVEEFSEREAKFNNMVFPVVKSINTKSYWILFFSILIVIILFGLINFLSGKFIENSKAVAEVSNSLISYNEEVKEIAKAVDKKISVLEAKVDVIDKNVDKNQTAVMSWLKPAAEMLDRHEAKFVKMTKEVSYLKKKKAEEIKKAEEEALKSLEIENPPVVDLPNPVEEKEESKPEGTEDGGNTDSLKKTSAVGKTMPEIDNKDDSESEIKITVRKISIK
jgi:hypothetical protein